jgi:hypothetical protein
MQLAELLCAGRGGKGFYHFFVRTRLHTRSTHLDRTSQSAADAYDIPFQFVYWISARGRKRSSPATIVTAAVERGAELKVVSEACQSRAKKRKQHLVFGALYRAAQRAFD